MEAARDPGAAAAARTGEDLRRRGAGYRSVAAANAARGPAARRGPLTCPVCESSYTAPAGQRARRTCGRAQCVAAARSAAAGARRNTARDAAIVAAHAGGASAGDLAAAHEVTVARIGQIVRAAARAGRAATEAADQAARARPPGHLQRDASIVAGYTGGARPADLAEEFDLEVSRVHQIVRTALPESQRYRGVRNPRHAQRDAAIAAARAAGASWVELARRYGLSITRIQQIVRAAAPVTTPSSAGAPLPGAPELGAEPGASRSPGQVDALTGFSIARLLVLLSLAEQPRHGKAIAADLAQHAAIALGFNAEVPVLDKLTRLGHVVALPWHGRTRPHQITDAGRAALAAQLQALARVVDLGHTRLTPP